VRRAVVCACAEVICEPISSLLKNALIVETQGSAYGAMVTYTCKYGYRQLYTCISTINISYINISYICEYAVNIYAHACKYGYQFVIASDKNLDPTSAIRKTVRCNVDGRWGPNFADCQRE